MRRFVLLVGLTLTLLCTVGSPAFAQVRDPFVPLVGADGGVPGESGGGTGEQPNFEPMGPTGGNGMEGLPTTGGSTGEWWVLAYGLMAAGGTALLVAWSRRPIPLR